MKIRFYQDHDFDQVLNLFNENSDFDQLTQSLLEEKLTGDPFYDQQTTFVAEMDNKIVGFMQGVQRELPTEKIGYIKLMVVDKGFRRQGIARAMYEKLEEDFQGKKNG